MREDLELQGDVAEFMENCIPQRCSARLLLQLHRVLFSGRFLGSEHLNTPFN